MAPLLFKLLAMGLLNRHLWLSTHDPSQTQLLPLWFCVPLYFTEKNRVAYLWSRWFYPLQTVLRACMVTKARQPFQLGPNLQCTEIGLVPMPTSPSCLC